jgi:outer membrane protein
MKTIRKNFFCFLLGIVFLLQMAPLAPAFSEKNPAGSENLDLKSCIVLAVQNDPEVNRAKDQNAIGRLLKNEAFKALVLPRIDLETTYGPKLDYFGRPVFPESESLYDSRVVFDKPLYKGGALVAQYEVGKKEISRSDFDLLEKSTAVMENTTRKYYQLLSAQENLRNYVELKGQIQKTVDMLEKKVSIGAALRVDLLEVETQLAEVEYRIAKAKGGLESATAALNEIIGLDPRTLVVVKHEFPIKPLKGDMEVWIADALGNRPDLMYQQDSVELTQLKMDLNESRKFPELSLVGSYSWEGDEFPGKDKEWSIGLALTYFYKDAKLSSSLADRTLYKNPFNFIAEDDRFNISNLKLSLFDGYSNAVGLEYAKAEHRFESKRLEKLKKSVIKEVRDAVNKLRETVARTEASRKTIEYAEEKLNILEEKMRSKETTEIDVLESKVSLVEARIRWIQSRYDNGIALAGLYKAIGKRFEWKGIAE